MSGGSRERDSPRDQQCGHCGRYYSPKGLTGHEPHCPLRDYDTVLVDLEETTHPLDEDDNPPEESAPAPTDPVGDGASPAATDGGEAMSPPTFDDADAGVDDDRGDDDDDFDADSAAAVADGDGDPGPDPIDCPECDDGDFGVTPDDVADGDRIRCEGCGARKRWRAEA